MPRPYTRDTVSAEELRELLEDILRFRNLESIVANRPNRQALLRRIYDILHGKVERVSIRVADNICIAANHPEWLQILT